MFLPRLSATLLCALVPTMDGQESNEIPQTPQPEVLGVDVTFLANDGFFLESGKYSVLIDAFLREPVLPYGALPDAAYKDLVNGRPPYDGLTLVLVSHDHPDHVQYRPLEKFLGRNNEAQLLAHRQVAKALREKAWDYPAIQRRVTGIPTARVAGNRVVQKEMSVEFLELDHGGKANTDVLNLGHLLEIGGLRILHVGDAEPTIQNFRVYALDKREIDIAIVPYWFFGSPEGIQVLNEEIRAKTIIAAHVPTNEQEKLSALLTEQFPNVILFEAPLEKRNFFPDGAGPKSVDEGEPAGD